MKQKSRRQQMKRGIIVATLMMTAAGVASGANLLTTAPSQGVASPWPQSQPATEAPRIVATASGPEKAAPAPAVPVTVPVATPKGAAPAPTVQKASVEARQAPVPYQLKPRPPVNLPPVADKDKATEAKASGKSGDKPEEASPADTGGENAARAAIEADGYKGVKVLRKGANGVWHASALRGKTTVMLTVDASGSVSAE
jgi:hypothetical protein